MPRSNGVDDTALQTGIDAAAPGHLGGKLELRLASGRTISLELWPCRSGPAGASEMEQNILMALEEADQPLTGDKLAEAAGYAAESGAFKRAVKSLLESGQILNARPGYKLP